MQNFNSFGLILAFNKSNQLRSRKIFTLFQMSNALTYIAFPIFRNNEREVLLQLLRQPRNHIKNMNNRL